jgi:deoxyhypusine monooxygenase
MASTAANNLEGADETILTLRKVLVNESEPLARRFRALFSLKYLACLQPPTEKTLPAIEAIAAGFTSTSELLKHELAYCLGQTRNIDAVSYLLDVVKNTSQDAMCRHEAAEGLGALGFDSSLDVLKALRDDENEADVIRETCDIAVDRILWENSEERKAEKLKPRYYNYIQIFSCPQSSWKVC